MKILFVSDTYFPHVNGVYYFVRRLAVLLQERGHEISVLVPSADMHWSEKIIDGIRVYGVPSLPVMVYPKIRFPIPLNLRMNVKKTIQKLRPDIIHIQDHFALARAVVKVNMDVGIPIIGTNHFMPENVTALLPISIFNKGLEKWMWSSFTKVFNQLKLVTTPTDMAARLIRVKLGVDVLAVSNGIDLERFNQVGDTGPIREKYSIPNKPILLYVGRLDPEKQLDEVLRAVAQALKSIDFCLVIVGKGVKREALEQLSEKLGIRDNVVFAGFVPDTELPFFYRVGNCFIMASVAELQSISTMEGMASGLPIIAADAGALDELVHDGKNGYLFDHGDISTLAKHIEKILSKHHLNKEMGNNSIKIILKHDIGQTVDAFERIYKEIKKRDPMTLRVVSRNEHG